MLMSGQDGTTFENMSVLECISTATMFLFIDHVSHQQSHLHKIKFTIETYRIIYHTIYFRREAANSILRSSEAF